MDIDGLERLPPRLRALDSELRTSGTLPGFSAIFRDSVSVEPFLIPSFYPSPILGTVAGTSSAKVGFVAISARQVDSVDYALKVDDRHVQNPYALTAAAAANVSVDAASETLVAANTSRKGLVIVNNDPTDRVSLGIGAAAVLDAGITLFANGGTWVMDDRTFTTGAINAIGSAAAVSVGVQEFT